MSSLQKFKIRKKNENYKETEKYFPKKVPFIY